MPEEPLLLPRGAPPLSSTSPHCRCHRCALVSSCSSPAISVTCRSMHWCRAAVAVARQLLLVRSRRAAAQRAPLPPLPLPSLLPSAPSWYTTDCWGRSGRAAMDVQLAALPRGWPNDRWMRSGCTLAECAVVDLRKILPSYPHWRGRMHCPLSS